MSLRLVLSALLAATLIALAPARAAAQAPATTRDIPIDFRALSAGERFTCGLSTSGEAYCWGFDDLGQLGAGAPVDRCERSIYATGPCARAPLAVAGGGRFVSIVTGSRHACGLLANGVVGCWGGNQFGQLGVADAGATCRHNFGSRTGDWLLLPCSRVPVRVPLEREVVSVAAGEHRTCAVDVRGELWCWPQSRDGAPTRVPLDRPLVAVAMGGGYGCGLTTDHGVRCWSAADTGFITPSPRTDFTSLTVGERHACALDAEGRAWCWGSDADGALGIGGEVHRKYDPFPATEVLGGHRFTTIATGATRTCAIDGDQALWCWGRVPEAAPDDECFDSNGIAGTNACTTRPARVHAGTRFRSVSVGWQHQCAITTAGATVCWGANETGQLGNGSLRASNALAAVRTKGVTRGETRMIDLREGAAWLLTHGGVALLLLLPLALFARGWMATRGPLELVLLWIAAALVAAVLRANVWPNAAAAQPLLLAGGITAFRVAAGLRTWWRRGPDMLLAQPAGTVRILMDSRDAGAGAGRGMLALGTVLAGWLFVGLMLGSGSSGAHDDVAAGIAAAAMFFVGSAALVLSAIGTVIAIVTLRRHRRATTARIALALGALTLAAGLLLALWLFWPTER